MRIYKYSKFINLVGIVVGFYFGAKTAAEKRAEAAAEITIENVRFPFEKVAITIRNGGDSKITVDRIYRNEKIFDIKNVKILVLKTSLRSRNPINGILKPDIRLK